MDAAAIISTFMAMFFLVVAGAGLMTVIVDVINKEVGTHTIVQTVCAIILIILASTTLITNVAYGVYCT
jgi:hypothetical protein